VLTINHAKALQGKLTLPPSPDLFLVAAFASIAAKQPIRIHPLNNCPTFNRWMTILDGHAALTRENDACVIDPRSGVSSNDIVFTDSHIPYRDLTVFLALGARKRVLFRRISEKRLALWRDQAQRTGFVVEIVQEGETRGLTLAAGASQATLPSSIEEQDIHPVLGLLFGLRAKHSFQIDCTLSTPFRWLCASLGYDIEVQRDIGDAEKDPLVRRMRIKARQRLSSQDQLFAITADFSSPSAVEGITGLLLPGDEVLLALFLTAKSLIPKGSLVIDNAPLEPWAAPLIMLMRKMGCKLSQQETHQTAFGTAGAITFPRFALTGQKADFVPHYYYDTQLPAMAVLAAFAEGQSVFRKFNDLRLNDPDGIKQLEACLKTVGVKYGDMPDGFVIKGDRQHDGFDLIEPLPAPLAGAFAVAGLHCVGSTTVNDETLLERWPDFADMLGKFCEFSIS
jgi:hypothetical protein